MTQLWRWSLVLLCTAAIATSLTVFVALGPALQAQVGRDQAGSGASVIESAVAASVQLFAEREGGARRAGSGVVVAVDRDGTALILTAAHLIEPLTKQTVSVSNPDGAGTIPARILHSDPDSDTAILEADGLMRQTVELRGDARLGDDVWVVSYPWGRHRTLVSGVVSQVEAKSRSGPGVEAGRVGPSIEGPVRLIDAAVSYGTSGGGVFDRRTGTLLGIVRGYRTAKLSFPGGGDESLNVPIAGETTVIPTSRILCVLQTAKLADRLAVPPQVTEHPGGFCSEN